MPRGLREYFRKPSGRAGRHPHYLEIVVARTGHPGRTFRINLDTLKKVSAALGTVAFVWFAGTFYVAYSHLSNQEAIARAGRQAERIALLESSNERLAEEKQNMDQSLLTLRERVEQLAGRVHGLVNQAESEFPVERSNRPQGGVAIPLDANNARELMKSEMASLDERMDRLLPELERSLARELARPVGIPVAGNQDISSRYGVRGNPFGRGHEFHNGVDFVIDTGTPILATGPGVVEAAGYEGPNGNRVAINHGFGYRSVFAHLSKVQVKPGDQVKRGQVVGLSGNTGRSSGPHLHYTLYYHGKTINPDRYLKPH
jgi:murein DD-endopeptidase MepM/ murein hydrolase activator NlpD